MEIRGKLWEAQALPMSPVEYLSLVMDLNGNPMIAYNDNYNGLKTMVKHWDGNSWQLIEPADLIR